MTVSMRFLVLSYCEERGITEYDFDDLPEDQQVAILAVRRAKNALAAWQNYEARKRMK